MFCVFGNSEALPLLEQLTLHFESAAFSPFLERRLTLEDNLAILCKRHHLVVQMLLDGGSDVNQGGHYGNVLQAVW
jgi:hypothetical protein